MCTLQIDFCFAQHNKYNNHLQRENNLIEQGKYEEVIKLNQKMIIEYQENKVFVKAANSYVTIATMLRLLSKYDEALKSLKLAETQLEKSKDNAITGRIYIEYGRIYDEIGLHKIANNNFCKAIAICNKIDKESNKKFLSYAFSRKALSTDILKNPDSSLYYLKKSNESLPMPSTLTCIAFNFLQRNQLDSAEFYIKKAESQYLTAPDHVYQKSQIFLEYGNLYFEKKDYKRALENYQNAKEIYLKIKYASALRDLYGKITVTYDSLNNYRKSKEYLIKYRFLNDSLNNVQKKVLDISVQKFLDEQEQKAKYEKTKIYYILGGIFISILFGGVIGSIFYKREKKKEKQKTLNLEKKLSTSIDEIMLLAKNNDPIFLTRFREVYPEFIDRLLSINPKLINSELKFCALLFINLSTKEIAQITFVETNAIRNRKARIRKKLNIPSNEDIYVWMNNLLK